MKVTHVITDTNFGGGGRYLLYLIPQPAFEGHDVSVACPDGDLAKRLADAGVRRIPIRTGKNISYSHRLTRELLQVFRDERPDVVHTHSCLSGRIAARMCRIPVVYTKHNQTRIPDAMGVTPPPAGPVKRVVNRALSELLSDGIVAVSEGVQKELVESGVKPSIISTIPNGIDLSPYGPTAGRDSSRGPLIGTVARLHRQKALDVFIDAAKLVLASEPSARFVIGGTGPLEEELKAKIKDSRLEPYVKMPGFVFDVPTFLSGLDVYVLCSDYEGIGLAILEAMAAGLPVVATAVGGVPEAIADGVNGILVPPRNPRQLAQGIVRMLVDPDMAKTMGKAGRQRAEELFDAKVMAERTLSVYRRLSVRRERPSSGRASGGVD